MAQELRVSEYEALRTELEATSKRTYETVFLAVTVSAGLIGYSLKGNHVFVALSPLLLLYAAYVVLCQSLRSERRIVAYLRACHEGPDIGAMWETMLYERRISGKKDPSRIRPLAAQFQLLWLFGFASLAVSAYLAASQYARQHTLDLGRAILILVATIAWLVLYRAMCRANRDLAGGGKVEQDYHEWFTRRRKDLGYGRR